MIDATMPHASRTFAGLPGGLVLDVGRTWGERMVVDMTHLPRDADDADDAPIRLRTGWSIAAPGIRAVRPARPGTSARAGYGVTARARTPSPAPPSRSRCAGSRG